MVLGVTLHLGHVPVGLGISMKTCCRCGVVLDADEKPPVCSDCRPAYEAVYPTITVEISAAVSNCPEWDFVGQLLKEKEQSG